MEAETLVVIEVVVGAASSLKGIKMDAETWGFIGVVVGAALIARNASKAKTREFQKDNLIQLQDRLSKHVALTIKYRNKSIRDRFLTDAILDEFILSKQTLTILTKRIADKSSRESTERVTDTLHSVLSDKTIDDDEKMKIIKGASEEVWEEIGVALRSNY